jgi:hypothetical protein
LDSPSEPTQLEEKKEEDFFAATLNSESCNCAEENEDHISVQSREVCFFLILVNWHTLWKAVAM